MRCQRIHNMLLLPPKRATQFIDRPNCRVVQCETTQKLWHTTSSAFVVLFMPRWSVCVYTQAASCEWKRMRFTRIRSETFRLCTRASQKVTNSQFCLYFFFFFIFPVIFVLWLSTFFLSRSTSSSSSSTSKEARIPHLLCQNYFRASVACVRLLCIG